MTFKTTIEVSPGSAEHCGSCKFLGYFEGNPFSPQGSICELFRERVPNDRRIESCLDAERDAKWEAK